MNKKQHLRVKRCDHCRTKKAIRNFSFDGRTIDGFSFICDLCKEEAPPGYSFVFRKIRQKTLQPGQERECPQCKQTKGYSEFPLHKQRQQPDRRCRECHRRKGIEYRKSLSPERKRQNREYQKNYRQTEKGRESIRKGRQRYYQNNRDKFRARSAVTYAVLRGELPHVSTQVCRCGKQAENWHHHKGYEKEFWIDVEPVCKKCHYTLRERKAVYKVSKEA